MDRRYRLRPSSAIEPQKSRKADPVIRAGDAGGPGDGRNITTVNLSRDAGRPLPNELEPIAFSAIDPRKPR